MLRSRLLLSLFIGLACLGGAGVVYWSYQNGDLEISSPVSIKTSQQATTPPIEASLLSLFGHQLEEPYAVQRVREEVRYVGRVDHPGESGDRCWLCLRDGDSPRQAGPGEAIPLEFDPTATQLHLKWGNPGSPLALRVQQMTGEGLQAEVELCDVGCYPVMMKLHEAPRQRSWDVAGHVVDQRLLLKMEGRWFGTDQLCSDATPDQGPFQHFEFGFGPRCYAVAIPAKGTLSYVEGKWIAGCYSGHPVVRIDSVEAQRINLKIWDAVGLLRGDLQMPRLTSNSDLNGLASQLRLKSLRGQRRALIQLGSQNFLCREGDWLVKRGETWQVLSSTTNRASWWQTSGVGEVIVIERVQRARGKPQVQLKLYSAVHADAQSMTLHPTGISNTAAHPPGGNP